LLDQKVNLISVKTVRKEVFSSMFDFVIYIQCKNILNYYDPELSYQCLQIRRKQPSQWFRHRMRRKRKKTLSDAGPDHLDAALTVSSQAVLMVFIENNSRYRGRMLLLILEIILSFLPSCCNATSELTD